VNTDILNEIIDKPVKNERSGLNIFILPFLFYFIFDLFSFILFLEPGLGLE